MRTALLTAVALVAVATATPAAADSDHHYRGGCTLLTAPTPTLAHALRPARWHAVVYAAGRTTDGGGNPTVEPIQIRCDLYVAGSLVAEGVVTSNGEPAAGHTTYAADAGDDVTICEYVTVGSHWPTYRCTDAVPVVPEPVWAAIEVLVEQAGPIAGRLVYQFCPIAASWPGQYGPLLINDEGDVYVYEDGEARHWYDCPPYG